MTSLTWPQRLAFSESTKRLRGLELPLPVTQQISYTAAMEEAPRRSRLKSTEDELEYRKLYADELVRCGVARALGAPGVTSGSEQRQGKLRTIRISDEEYARQKAEAAKAGMPWATWVLARCR